MLPLFKKRTTPVVDIDLYKLDYAWSHGIYENTAGTGLLIKSIVELNKPNNCLIIGSGAGIIPRIIREAQISSGKSNGKTYLIDAGVNYGAIPEIIHNTSSVFRKCYSEIEVYKNYSVPYGFNWIKEKTQSLDIIFIDGDHSHEGSLIDFNTFSKLLHHDGYIFLHDTNFYFNDNYQVGKTVYLISKMNEFEIINFQRFGVGLALIKRKSVY